MNDEKIRDVIRQVSERLDDLESRLLEKHLKVTYKAQALKYAPFEVKAMLVNPLKRFVEDVKRV